jgi:hypothetical protein
MSLRKKDIAELKRIVDEIELTYDLGNLVSESADRLSKENYTLKREITKLRELALSLINVSVVLNEQRDSLQSELDAVIESDDEIDLEDESDWLGSFGDSKTERSIARGIQEAREGKGISLGSFSKYADDDLDNEDDFVDDQVSDIEEATALGGRETDIQLAKGDINVAVADIERALQDLTGPDASENIRAARLRLVDVKNLLEVAEEQLA